MPVAVPAAIRLTCPRCRTLRAFVAIDGQVLYRCAGCELPYSLATQAPTGTSNAALSAGGTAIGVASGGAAFTNGMTLLYDTGVLSEVLTVNGAATGTSIPVTAAVRGHLTAATFGQLTIGPTFAGYGVEQQPIPAPAWGY
jgi:hypothetical protein